MKKLMLGVAQNLARCTDHITLILPPLLLVMGIAFFNDKPFLFWATAFFLLLLAIGVICRQVLK